MSLPVFPKLAGVGWDVPKRPIFNTLVETAAAGNEYLTATQIYPIYEFDLHFDLLLPADLAQLLPLYLTSLGAFGRFYFDHFNDDVVPAAAPLGFGVGDGSNKVFTLLKSTGSFLEPIGGTSNNWGTNPATTNVIYDNGTPVNPSAYTVSDGGAGAVVTFTAAPANTHTLTWSGTYYYLCRFKDDKLDFNQFMQLLYEVKQLTLRTSR